MLNMLKVKPVYLVALALAGSVAALSNPQPANSDFDLPGLNNQVKHQAQVLDNHEARITNLEQDTKVIQVQTKVDPAPNPQPVPVVEPTVTVPSTEPEIQPVPTKQLCPSPASCALN